MATASSATPSQLSAADAPSPTTAARRGAMAVLAQARAEEIEQGLRAVMDPVDYVELRVGDTFPIGRASWRLVAVEDPDTWDYVVRIERVPEPGEPAGRPVTPLGGSVR